MTKEETIEAFKEMLETEERPLDWPEWIDALIEDGVVPPEAILWIEQEGRA